MVLGKHEIEQALFADQKEISAGRLKEDSPLDLSAEFEDLCAACRKGDLKVCHEKISAGVNINARDRFDYTPLILVSPTSGSVSRRQFE
jgi:ankyrin repeat and BTB/POZ domain-containing protein 1